MSPDFHTLPDFQSSSTSQDPQIFKVSKENSTKAAKIRNKNKNSLESKTDDVSKQLNIKPASEKGFFSRPVKHIKKFIGNLAVLPATRMFNVKSKDKKIMDNVKEANDLRNGFLKANKDVASRFFIKSEDDVKLDCMAIAPHKKSNPKEEKWIIYIGGNMAAYEHNLDNLQLFAEKTGANVLTGNPRGVLESEGEFFSTNDLVKDAHAKVEYLKSKGIPTENIILHGHSLGGGVATQVAALHQEEGQEIHLCVDRSFASLPQAVKGLATNFFGSKAIGKLMEKISSALLGKQYRLDSKDIYNELKGHKFMIYAENDQTITEEASLFNHVYPKKNEAEENTPLLANDSLKNKNIQIIPKLDFFTSEDQAHTESVAGSHLFNDYIANIQSALNIDSKEVVLSNLKSKTRTNDEKVKSFAFGLQTSTYDGQFFGNFAVHIKNESSSEPMPLRVGYNDQKVLMVNLTSKENLEEDKFIFQNKLKTMVISDSSTLMDGTKDLDGRVRVLSKAVNDINRIKEDQAIHVIFREQENESSVLLVAALAVKHHIQKDTSIRQLDSILDKVLSKIKGEYGSQGFDDEDLFDLLKAFGNHLINDAKSE